MQSHVSAEIPFSEGNESDFKDLREAIKSGKAQKNEYAANDSSEESDDPENVNKILETGYFPKPDENESEEEEEDDSEPEDPGLKLLWAAQHDNTELIQDLLNTNPDLVKFADSDGYTALHRAAYSGSHVRILLQSLLTMGIWKLRIRGCKKGCKGYTYVIIDQKSLHSRFPHKD